MQGKLYVVATPIGNLGDFSPRAVETLNTVDFIAAEDTRVGAKLLNKFGIKKPQVSYFEHNKRQKGQYIASRILEGESCAIITDAGTPAISDPGTDLVDICRNEGIEIVSVPGPSAIITALSISGMDCGRFCFEGFLSTSKKSRFEHLKETAREKRTMVFYEAPHKLLRTLEDMLEYYGDRPIALCRELTKMHEEVVRTTIAAAIEKYTETPPKGEFVLIIGGWVPTDEELMEGVPTMEMMLSEVQALVDEGTKLSSAVKTVSQKYGVSKNALYKEAQEL
ncbi:MAG: 16S rRNA (cytidine(1402)-2'-O)-methyltransferase [Clostridia bacterium]|nr:16S rRNA (cytidine(1402)-2'-O)-methyltransferase [Clostridia bacterium]MBQ5812972.1 16S rRNA (cytidine(1402)-2'-O)-methyltransferase [Clostridia bacterium]